MTVSERFKTVFKSSKRVTFIHKKPSTLQNSFLFSKLPAPYEF